MHAAPVKTVLIFGATGNTGRCALAHAVQQDYKVRAFVRDPAKVPAELQDKVECVVGDVLDPDHVLPALEGQDGVVVVLGTNNSLAPTTDMSEGLKNILAAMKAQKVSRITVCISSFLFMDLAKVPDKYKPLTEDHQRMLDALKASDVEWTAILPPFITEAPKTDGKYFVTVDAAPGHTISKYDLGEFLVDCLAKSEYGKKVVGIAAEGSRRS